VRFIFYAHTYLFHDEKTNNGRRDIFQNSCIPRRRSRSGAPPLGKGWPSSTLGCANVNCAFRFLRRRFRLLSSCFRRRRRRRRPISRGTGAPIDRFACCVEWTLPVSRMRRMGSTRGRSRRSTWSANVCRPDSNTRFGCSSCGAVGGPAFVVYYYCYYSDRTFLNPRRKFRRRLCAWPKTSRWSSNRSR